MASHRSAPSMYTTTKVCLLFSVLLVGMASAQLSSTFYDKSCPNAFSTVKSAIVSVWTYDGSKFNVDQMIILRTILFLKRQKNKKYRYNI